MSIDAPKLAEIDTKDAKEGAGTIDKTELTTYLKGDKLKKKEDFITLINDRKTEIKKLSGFTDSLKATANDIASKLKGQAKEEKVQDFDKIKGTITLADGTTQLTKNECAKILQAYSGIILNLKLTTNNQEYSKATGILADYDSANTFGSQMNAIIDRLSPDMGKTTQAPNKYQTAINEASDKLEAEEKIEAEKTIAINTLDMISPENDGYNEETIAKVDAIKSDGLDAINNTTDSGLIQFILQDTKTRINTILLPAMTEAKEKTTKELTEYKLLEQNMYNTENQAKIRVIKDNTKAPLEKATTPKALNDLFADAKKNIDDVPTLEQTAKKEQEDILLNSDKMAYKKEGKEWKSKKSTSIDITLNLPKPAGLSNFIPTSQTVEDPGEFIRDKDLTTFMNLNTKKENIFDKGNKKMFAYIAKNYVSLSKNTDIRKQIYTHITTYMENNDLQVNSKDLFLSAKVDTTGAYYFDIPLQGNSIEDKKGTKQLDGVTSISLFIQSIKFNKDKVTTEVKTTIEPKKTEADKKNTETAIPAKTNINSPEETKKSPNTITKNNLPSELQTYADLGTWIQKDNTYIVTLSNKVPYNQIDESTKNKLFVLEQTFNVKYINEGGDTDRNAEITSIEITTKQPKENIINPTIENNDTIIEDMMSDIPTA